MARGASRRLYGHVRGHDYGPGGNPSTPTSGVASTEYSLYGGTTWTSATLALPINTPGTYSASFRSKDGAGNQESPETAPLGC